MSFVRSAFDMVSVRTVLLRDDVMMLAKIETGEGVENLDEIIAVSDVDDGRARDLGVRMPIEEVPHLQKEMSATVFDTPDQWSWRPRCSNR